MKSLLDLPVEILYEILGDQRFSKSDIKNLRFVHSIFRDVIAMSQARRLFEVVRFDYNSNGVPSFEAIEGLLRSSNSATLETLRSYAKELVIAFDPPFQLDQSDGRLPPVEVRARTLIKGIQAPAAFPRLADIRLKVSSKSEWEQRDVLSIGRLYNLIRPQTTAIVGDEGKRVHADLALWHVLRPQLSLISGLPPLESLKIVVCFHSSELINALVKAIDNSPALRSLYMQHKHPDPESDPESSHFYRFMYYRLKNEDSLRRLERAHAYHHEILFSSNLQETNYSRLRNLKDAGGLSGSFDWNNFKINDIKLHTIHSSGIRHRFIDYLRWLPMNTLRVLKLRLDYNSRSTTSNRANDFWEVLKRFQDSLTHLEIRPRSSVIADAGRCECNVEELDRMVPWSPCYSDEFWAAFLRFKKMEVFEFVTPVFTEAVCDLSGLMLSIAPSLGSLQQLRFMWVGGDLELREQHTADENDEANSKRDVKRMVILKDSVPQLEDKITRYVFDQTIVRNLGPHHPKLVLQNLKWATGYATDDDNTNETKTFVLDRKRWRAQR